MTPDTGKASLAVKPHPAVLIPLALVTAAMAVPALWTHGAPALAFALSRGFALICHQHPERALWLFGLPVAVCARCLGIYLGAALGLLMRTSRTVALRLLIIAAALNALDVATEFAGLHGNWIDLRFVLGMVLGASAGLLVASAVSAFRVEEGAVQSS